MSNPVSRRTFIKTLGVAGAAAALPWRAAQASTSAPPAPLPLATAHETPTATFLGNLKEAYTFFLPIEAAFVEAAIDRLIPDDDLGPGARDAGVAYFIDQQLAGAYGQCATEYTQGPWAEGTPEQGYQHALVPAEIYRLGIMATNRYTLEAYQQTFDALAPEQQDDVLRGLETGHIALAEVPAGDFFALLLTNTIEGFFADPAYGGNRDMVGWKLVGFPGAAGHYADNFEEQTTNAPFTGPFYSLADIQQGPSHADQPMTMTN